MVGATFFAVAFLVVIFSTTLPCASGHLRISTAFLGRVQSCRWYFAVRVLSEFAVIAKVGNLNFPACGSDEQPGMEVKPQNWQVDPRLARVDATAG